jgi:hypothetical protein
MTLTPRTVWVNGPPYPIAKDIVIKSDKVRWSWKDCFDVVKRHPGCTTLFIAKKLQGVQDKSVRVMLDARIRHGDVHKRMWFNPKSRRHEVTWFPGRDPSDLSSSESKTCH